MQTAEVTRYRELAGRLRHVYGSVLPAARVWDAVRRLPSVSDRVGSADVPPGLATPLPDGMTPEHHLDATRDKADRPPRLALVGAFSTGKSTLLNAILHGKKFNENLSKYLGLSGRLLEVGIQATTGNVTELEVTGQPVDDAAGAGQYEFYVTYLSEREARSLVQHLAGKLGLNISADVLGQPNWSVKALELLQVPMRQKYEVLREGNQALDVRENLTVLRELLETLNKAELRAKVMAEPLRESLGDGKAGLGRFQRLQSRPTIDANAPWAAMKLHVDEFHLVKLLQFRFPHPDFEGASFSLFDFPGLGSGKLRDDYISQEFIPEANVLLMPFLSTAVGGAGVNFILDVFLTKRAGMTAEELLDRIYFVCANYPKRSPSAAAERQEFFKNFLQAVKTQMHLIVTSREQNEEKQRALYKKYLGRFVGCDGYVGGFYRADDGGGAADRSEHQNNQARGCFKVPTDTAALAELAKDPVLTNPGSGFPLLAGMLTDPAISSAIHNTFAAFAEDGGIGKLVTLIREFVTTGKAAQVKGRDIQEHLQQAARPLAVLRGLARPADGNTSSPAVLAARETFSQGLEWERKWLRVLQLWAKPPGTVFRPREEPAEVVKAYYALDQLERDLEQRVRKKVEEAVTPASLHAFTSQLAQQPESLVKWVEQGGGAGRLPGSSKFGAAAAKPVAVKPPEKSAPQKLLNLDHTLVLYRFFLKVRGELLDYFHRDLFRPLLDSVTGVYLQAGGGQWREFQEVWNRTLGLVDAGGVPDVQPVASARDGLADEVLGECVNGFLSGGPEFAGGPTFWPVAAVKGFLPADGGATGAGTFYLIDETTNRRFRVSEPPNPGPHPKTGKQLGALLARLRLPGFYDSNKVKRREAPAVPDLAEDAVRQVLVGVGYLSPGDSYRPAAADVDFWSIPLPTAVGRVAAAEPDGEVVVWNPVPFDPFAGRYRAESGQAEPPLLATVRQFLTQFLIDLSSRFLKDWKQLAYLQFWQQTLIERLESLNSDAQFWDWLDTNRAAILGVNPVEAALLELHACVTECERIGLFAGRPA
jgi:hypothetical protein